VSASPSVSVNVDLGSLNFPTGLDINCMTAKLPLASYINDLKSIVDAFDNGVLQGLQNGISGFVQAAANAFSITSFTSPTAPFPPTSSLLSTSLSFTLFGTAFTVSISLPTGNDVSNVVTAIGDEIVSFLNILNPFH